MALLETRPYRPFKSSEEYLEAMKEDLAEWLAILYPELMITAENFMDRLDTGIALCKHANYVRQAAEDYLARRQARNKLMTRSMTSGLAGPILAMGNVHYLPYAKSGTFFARDNVSNFITWCRKSLNIIECLLFETDDLIMRKNEKHVILCLLEVARRGAKFGILAPMLIQMERQIDREIAADNKLHGMGGNFSTKMFSGGTENNADFFNAATETDPFESDSENEGDQDDGPMLIYGPQPQIITNDLKSLDEMVRELVEKCTCPTQFPMVRVSNGKYRIGDTKVLIFVRILRSHVMVRVGGGWDTLSHYLDKHDPCRCRSQHRTSLAAKLLPRTNNLSNGIELHKYDVIYERPSFGTSKLSSNCNKQNGQISQNLSSSNSTNAVAMLPKRKDRSPSPSQKKFTPLIAHSNYDNSNSCLPTTNSNPAGNSILVSPKRAIDIRRKGNVQEGQNANQKRGLDVGSNHVQFENVENLPSKASSQYSTDVNLLANKFDNISDNGSEISDEGYRSLGVIQSNIQKRESLHSQTSMEDVDNNGRHNNTLSNPQLLPSDSNIKSPTNQLMDVVDSEFECPYTNDAEPQSLPIFSPYPADDLNMENKFAKSGVYINENKIIVDLENVSSIPKEIENIECSGKTKTPANGKPQNTKYSKTSHSAIPKRRNSLDNNIWSGSLQDLHSRNEAPAFSRKKTVYRSVRKATSEEKPFTVMKSPGTLRRYNMASPRDSLNTWSPPSGGKQKRCPTPNSKFHNSSTSPAISMNATSTNNTRRTADAVEGSNIGRGKSSTASQSPSPVKNYSSPLAQQLLEAASNAKNDAQILEKMKKLLSRYASMSNESSTTPTNKEINGKKIVYDDFTSAWVHSNGNLECSKTCTSLSKVNPKRASTASSVDSNHSRDVTVIASPRRERGCSKIPAPIRQNTDINLR